MGEERHKIKYSVIAVKRMGAIRRVKEQQTIVVNECYSYLRSHGWGEQGKLDRREFGGREQS